MVASGVPRGFSLQSLWGGGAFLSTNDACNACGTLRRRGACVPWSRRLPPRFPFPFRPATLAVSNLDLIFGWFHAHLIAVYPDPPCLRQCAPSSPTSSTPFAGCVVTDASTGVPAIACTNAGAELVVAEAGTNIDRSLGLIQVPFDSTRAWRCRCSWCGSRALAWGTDDHPPYLLVDGHGLTARGPGPSCCSATDHPRPPEYLQPTTAPMRENSVKFLRYEASDGRCRLDPARFDTPTWCGKWTEVVGMGTGSPALVVSAFVPFKVEGDFGFGRPRLVMPWIQPGRLGSAFDDGGVQPA
ncbi:hypothetical protein PR202_gb17891 [Eleusine coracana subsp. coracana]|uniref:Uncharacterized protein n=1 Tax=Eleusine coracana subsp. coracana TaxID=191504 RepID=A0AAV5F3I8_ELECO|nr:hypothetical protein PR202_gb17891 [Eleusine coracana subsp. coracana]